MRMSPLAGIPVQRGEARIAPSRWAIAGAGAVLAAAALAAYSRGFSGPFVFDDFPSIPDNPTIRHLWPLGSALAPPHGGRTVEGRPVLNLSFALNYAAGGTKVGGYHAVNLLIHVLAGLTLFGLLRRTFCLPSLRQRYGAAALPLALAIAGLWTLHPLATAAVLYVVQRAESLMGLFYLLTLYAFVRGAAGDGALAGGSGDSPPPRARGLAAVAWLGCSWLACLLGMGTKEVMVTAPVLVFCYDRAFLAGTFREAWRRRWRFYLALAATWIPLGLLVAGTGGNRGGTSGFGAGAGWWGYEATQVQAVGRYLWLAVWPHPLVFEYGPFRIGRMGEILPYAVLVVPLAAAALWAWWERPAVGYLGLWFFGILAPTSLVSGPAQMVVEHRMYLPLAAVLTVLVAGAYRLGGRRAWPGVLAVALIFGGLTARRARDYRSELSLWQDTAAKRPASPTAHSNLGMALAAAGRPREAMAEFEQVLRLLPGNVPAHTALGNLYSEIGQPEEGLRHLAAALRMAPDYAPAHHNLGVVLDRLGRTPEAVREYEEAVRLQPDFAEAHNDYGDALLRLGRPADAARQAEAALSIRPGYADAHYNLADALAQSGELDRARAQFAEGRRLAPGDASALHGWANALARAEHPEEALVSYVDALALNPDDAALHYDFGNALAAVSRMPEAARQYGEALRLHPGDPAAHDNLGNALVLLHRDAEAIGQYRESLRLNPANPRALNNLGLACARLGQMDAAVAAFAAAVGLAPDFQAARENLARAEATDAAGPTPP